MIEAFNALGKHVWTLAPEQLVLFLKVRTYLPR